MKIEQSDIDRIKFGISCVVEAGKWGYPMHEVRGDQIRPYHGACPFCNTGEDRFMVTKNQQRFWCRQCDESGDIYDLVMHVGNLTFIEAHEHLIGYSSGISRIDKSIKTVDLALAPEEPLDPFAEVNQRQRRDLINEFRWDLFHGSGSTKKVFESPQMAFGKYTALEYLDSRGVGTKQQSDFMLGYNSNPRKIADKIMPEGIVIPLMGEHALTGETGHIVGFKVRTFESKYPKYWRIGKGSYCLNQDSLDTYRTAIVAEGEFDCMVLDTYLGGRYACVTMGGTTGMREGKLHRLFMETEKVYWCYDNDEAGYKALQRAMRKTNGGRFKSIQLPDGVNDVTDLFQTLADPYEFEEYFYTRIEGSRVD